MATYNTSDFKKGLKVQIDGEPYQMTDMQFVKPGKGNAFYKCRLKNLIRGTTLDRTYKGGDSLESADVETTDVSFLYRQGEDYVFMHQETFEQFEVSKEVAGDIWKYLQGRHDLHHDTVQWQRDHRRTTHDGRIESDRMCAGSQRRHGDQRHQTSHCGNGR